MRRQVGPYRDILDILYHNALTFSVVSRSHSLVTPRVLLCGSMAGFLVTVLEAPFLCMFIDFVQNLSKKMENASAFFKGGLYIA